MKVALINPPWYDENHPEFWGVRAGSRWPHFQKRPEAKKLPRYIPFPFFLAISASIIKNAGHEVLLIDAIASDIKSEKLCSEIIDFKPDLIFAETASPSLSFDLKLFQQLKDKLPEAFITCSGIHERTMVKNSFEK